MSTTLLVVDDDDEIRELLCDYLTDAGYTVLAAADGDGMRQQLALALSQQAETVQRVERSLREQEQALSKVVEERLDRTEKATGQIVTDLRERLDGPAGEAFVRAVRMVLACKGRLVVMGMGKSGHVGRKIAATLASTGTPAFFVHPAEASHGDLGMVTGDDLVLAISNSGESGELTAILPVLKRLGAPLIAITGGLQSTLARHADLVLDCSVEREACPLNLAPTASTTAQLAMGDALAVSLLDARGFKADDFARSHPGGALGRKLLTHVSDVMRASADVPRVLLDADLMTLMREISAKGLGMTLVFNLVSHLLQGDVSLHNTDTGCVVTLSCPLNLNYAERPNHQSTKA